MAPSALEWRPRRTLIDLYEEKDRIPWYFRGLAMLSAMLLMLSLLLFPASWPGVDTGSQSITPKIGMILSVVFLALAYLMSGALAFCIRSSIFRFEVICLPHLFSGVAGLLNLVLTLGVYGFITMGGEVIASLALAMLSILIYTFCALLAFKNIYTVRKSQRGSRERGSRKTFNMPETELQRQQLLRLLLSQGDDNHAHSPEKGTEATYKIHWPGSTMAHTRRNTATTIRNHLPFNQGSTRHSASYHHHPQIHSRTSHQPLNQPPAELHGHSHKRSVPDVIIEESIPTTAQDAPILPSHSNHPHSQVHNPLLPAFFDHHPGDRVPSYALARPSTHNTPQIPNQHDFTSPDTRHFHGLSSSPPLPRPLDPYGYPIDKPEAYNHPSAQNGGHAQSKPLGTFTLVQDEDAVRNEMGRRNKDGVNGDRKYQ